MDVTHKHKYTRTIVCMHKHIAHAHMCGACMRAFTYTHTCTQQSKVTMDVALDIIDCYRRGGKVRCEIWLMVY